eukprot:g64026.t1
MPRYVRLQRSTVALHTLDPNVLPEHGVEFWVAEEATAQIEQLEQDVLANIVEAKAAGEEAKKALKRARAAEEEAKKAEDRASAAEEEAKKAEERATAAEKQSVQLTRRLLELKGQLQEIGAAIVVPISGDENRQGQRLRRSKSRYLWVVPLKDKTAVNVLGVFKAIGVKPDNIVSDSGGEFKALTLRHMKLIITLWLSAITVRSVSLTG